MFQTHRFAVVARIVTHVVFVGLSVGCGGSVTTASGLPDAGEALPEMSPSTGSSVDRTGSVDAEIQLPAGAIVSSASYRLTGPVGFLRSDVLDFLGSQAIGFYIASVPASNGDYTLEVTVGSSSDPAVCTASAALRVASQQTTHVSLTAVCKGIIAPVPPPSAASSPPSSSPPPPPSSQAPPPQVVLLGSAGVIVKIPSGVSLSSLGCDVRGPGGLDLMDTLAVTAGSPLAFIITNLPAGQGYTIAVTGTSTDGGETCGTKGVFDVIGQEKTSVILDLACPIAMGNAEHDS